MKKHIVLIACASTLIAAGCQTTETQNKTIGAVGGAVVGGVIGNQVGGRRSTVVGAALGGAFGYLIGSKVGVTEQPDGSVKLDIPGAVLFQTDSAQLNPNFQDTLNQIAGTLQEHPNASVSVVGHTDSTGSDAYNMKLSQDRALAVTNYLTAQGVAPTRMTATGQGETMPVADNATPEGRAQNRRVEMYVR